jgi:serine protease Do
MVATTPRPETSAPVSRLGGLGADAASVADRLRDAVVMVSGQRHGAGSGTIWQPDGLIVTNNHVAPEARAQVTLRDGRTFAGEVIARDPENDLAALRIVADNLPAVEVRDSDSVRVGEVVVAVGNPWGQRGAVSSGIVFSKNGASLDGLGTLGKAIRADVALAPGNSGGPLADSDGRVIGINAMIVGGMAVAVPSNTVMELLSSGAHEPGIIGIVGQPVAVPAAFDSADGAGLIITTINEGSPAEEAGLIPGDVLLAVGDRPRSLVGVAAGLKRMRAGVPVSLAVARAGVTRRVEATPVAQS